MGLANDCILPAIRDRLIKEGFRGAFTVEAEAAGLVLLDFLHHRLVAKIRFSQNVIHAGFPFDQVSQADAIIQEAQILCCSWAKVAPAAVPQMTRDKFSQSKSGSMEVLIPFFKG